MKLKLVIKVDEEKKVVKFNAYNGWKRMKLSPLAFWAYVHNIGMAVAPIVNPKEVANNDNGNTKSN